MSSSVMHDDTGSPSESPEVMDAVIDGEAALVIAEETPPPATLTIGNLIRACRLLQQRIPGFDQLSVREAQSMIRVATLSPEFLNLGIEAACAFDGVEDILDYSCEELRDLSARIAHQGELQREFQKLADGVGAAILKDKHRLGQAILILYTVLQQDLRNPRSKRRHLRPYYENMRQAYMKGRKTRRKPEPKE
jgi:hypothetical protein